MDDIRILLVEDVAINRFIVRQYLQSIQHLQVDEASNGLEAIDKVKIYPYDIILMDIRMPAMDGYEAARAIRSMADPRLRNIPIIALTADTSRDLTDESMHVFTDVVSKPFNPGELHMKVMKHTANKSMPGFPEEVAAHTETETVDHRKIEDTLHHDLSRALNFYKVTEKALIDYKKKYGEAIRQQNAAEAGNISHKAKMTLKTLGLEALSTLLEDGQFMINQEISPERLQMLLQDVNQRFDQAIDVVRNRLEQVKQQGL